MGFWMWWWCFVIASSSGKLLMLLFNTIFNGPFEYYCILFDVLWKEITYQECILSYDFIIDLTFIWFNGSFLKMVENAFYFMLKLLFVFKEVKLVKRLLVICCSLLFPRSSLLVTSALIKTTVRQTHFK